MGFEVTVRENNIPKITAALDQALNRVVREQVFATQRDVQANIQKYGLIDTGMMLNSVQGTMTGQHSGEVTDSAQSGDGFPYPAAQNFGTRYIPASPFFSEAVTKAEQEFPPRVSAAVKGATG